MATTKKPRTVTGAELKRDPSAVVALGTKEGSVTIVDDDGRACMQVVVHQDAKPQKTRVLIGYRVVREHPETGEREWLRLDWSGCWGPSDMSIRYSTATHSIAKRDAERHGGPRRARLPLLDAAGWVMGRMLHMCIDIRGMLRWPKRKLKGAVVDNATGRRLSADEVREWLMDRLAEGKRVLPLGECNGFSYETGCPGHEQ